MDSVKAFIIPDVSTRLAALRTGKIDRLQDISWQDAESLDKTNPELKKTKYLSGEPGMAVGQRTDKAPFSDVRVRRALQIAIDRQAIIKDYFKGNAILVNWPFKAAWGEDLYTPVDKLSPSAKELFEYNPQKAKQLLADAGYPKGFKTEVVTSEKYADLVSMCKAWWKDIGVDAEIKIVDTSTLGVILFAKSYLQLMVGGPTIGASSPYVTGYVYFISGGGYNFSVVNDPVF